MVRLRNFYRADVSQTILHSIDLDVTVADFIQNVIKYERYTEGIHLPEALIYGLSPVVRIGTLNIVRISNQYDPAGAKFDYGDVNHDGRIAKFEFGIFMR
ncbi:unnamed protein product [Rotaria sp. Silwood1]|nr:unnamed protein product [Rotaria sp. Silwood1]